MCLQTDTDEMYIGISDLPIVYCAKVMVLDTEPFGSRPLTNPAILG